MPNIRYYARLEDCTKGKTPKYVIKVQAGYYPPMDKIKDRINEINEKQAEQERAKKDASISAEEIEALNAKRNYRSTESAGAQADLKSTFAKFGV